MFRELMLLIIGVVVYALIGVFFISICGNIDELDWIRCEDESVNSETDTNIFIGGLCLIWPAIAIILFCMRFVELLGIISKKMSHK